jgi:hypothetical protein
LAKITIPDVAGGFSLQTDVNTRLQQIEDELNTKVLYRNNPVGEDNGLENDVDMCGFDIINAGTVNMSNFLLNGVSYSALFTDAVAAAAASKDQAALSETAASSSEASSANSETAASDSADQAELSAVASAASAASVGYQTGTDPDQVPLNSFLALTSVISVGSVAELLALPTSDFIDGKLVIVTDRISGVATSGGTFRLYKTNGSTVDGDIILVPDDAAGSRWVRVSNSLPVNPLGRKITSGILPVGDIELLDTFNNTLNASLYFDGVKVQYTVLPYDFLDFEKWETVTQYYVNYSAGTDGGAGTSTGAGAWKTFDYAIANASSPAVINFEDDIVGSLSAAASFNSFTGKLKLKGKAARTLIAGGMRENYDLASFAWSASGANGAYVSTTGSANFYRAQFDAKYRDVNGIPRPIIDAESIAACQTTAGTYFWDSDASDLYVHMHDDRIPDPADGWYFAQSAFRTTLQQGGDTAEDIILCENLEFTANTGTATLASFRYRPVTTGAETSARFGMRNCLSYGSAGNAFEIYDADIVAMDDCHAGYNTRDGLNYHSFVTTGTKGEYMTVYEHNCTAKQSGFAGFADQAVAGSSSNGSTAHDSMHILRTNGVFNDTVGAVVADVNGTHSLNYNVAAGNPLAGASPRACFWHEKFFGEGTTKEMYLWGCSGWDKGISGAETISTIAQSGGDVNRGEITVDYWRGQPDGVIDGVIL